MEKETEIEGLARMVADGLSTLTKHMDEKFDAVDERFGKMQDYMDERFDRLEKEVRDTNSRIDIVVIPTLDSHSRRIKALEEAT